MPKILIVDDDVPSTTLLQQILSLNGYEAVVENDSSNVIQIATSIIPDLFLLDLMMPEPNGLKLCRSLRATPQFSHTPIIIITALDDNDSRMAARGAGASDFLPRPYRIAELLETVTRFLS